MLKLKKTINIKPLDHKINIFIYPNAESITKNNPEFKSNYYALTENTGFGKINIYFAYDVINHGVIAHEAYHAACDLMSNIDDDTKHSEVIAYHLEYIVERATAALLEYQKKIDDGE